MSVDLSVRTCSCQRLCLGEEVHDEQVTKRLSKYRGKWLPAQVSWDPDRTCGRPQLTLADEIFGSGYISKTVPRSDTVRVQLYDAR